MDSKQTAGEKAVECIRDGMIVGLGTGSTVFWMIQKISELINKGLSIRGIPTSKETEELAIKLGIPLIDFSKIDYIDVTIDGADEIDHNLDLIKGGGGALLREKIVASASRKLVIVADESKLVKKLGAFPLPVEVTRFGWEYTLKNICKLGGDPNIRMIDDKPFLTDNGNYILDCRFDEISNPNKLNINLNMIPGVVENGLFSKMADVVIIGQSNGKVKSITK
jgi:ribose 5-phosphate isomerase A